MTSNRRRFLKRCLTLSATGLLGTAASTWLRLPLLRLSTPILTGSSFAADAAWQEQNFARTSLNASLQNLYPDAKITVSDAISLKLPRIAENGAVVPITISSTLPKVTDMAIFVAKNPTPLSAMFKLSPDLEATVSARIKMAETSDVLVVITSDGQLFKATQEVKVTIGGCGG